eukprot:Nk52_evm7s1315 gene=Nk52_evmTU7s1315
MYSTMKGSQKKSKSQRRKTFNAGDRAEAYYVDKKGVGAWYVVKILELNEQKNMALCHFNGFAKRHDQWFQLSELRPAKTPAKLKEKKAKKSLITHYYDVVKDPKDKQLDENKRLEIKKRPLEAEGFVDFLKSIDQGDATGTMRLKLKRLFSESLSSSPNDGNGPSAVPASKKAKHANGVAIDTKDEEEEDLSVSRTTEPLVTVVSKETASESSKGTSSSKCAKKNASSKKCKDTSKEQVTDKEKRKKSAWKYYYLPEEVPNREAPEKQRLLMKAKPSESLEFLSFLESAGALSSSGMERIMLKKAFEVSLLSPTIEQEVILTCHEQPKEKSISTKPNSKKSKVRKGKGKESSRVKQNIITWPKSGCGEAEEKMYDPPKTQEKALVKLQSKKTVKPRKIKNKKVERLEQQSDVVTSLETSREESVQGESISYAEGSDNPLEELGTDKELFDTFVSCGLAGVDEKAGNLWRYAVNCDGCSAVLANERYYCTSCEVVKREAGALGSASEEYVSSSFDLCLRCFESNNYRHEHPRESFKIDKFSSNFTMETPLRVNDRVNVSETRKAENILLYKLYIDVFKTILAEQRPMLGHQSSLFLGALQSIVDGGYALPDLFDLRYPRDAAESSKRLSILNMFIRDSKQVCSFCKGHSRSPSLKVREMKFIEVPLLALNRKQANIYILKLKSLEMGQPLSDIVLRESVNSSAKGCLFRHIWAHEDCARFSPEVIVSKDKTLWYNIITACQRTVQLHCKLCRKTGATIGCFNPSCKNTYHLLCIQKMPNSKRDLSFFEDGNIFWCPSCEKKSYKNQTEVFRCDNCNETLDDYRYMCRHCETNRYPWSSFDVCESCFGNNAVFEDSSPENVTKGHIHHHPKESFIRKGVEVYVEETEQSEIPQEKDKTIAKKNDEEVTPFCACCSCFSDEWFVYVNDILLCPLCFRIFSFQTNSAKGIQYFDGVRKIRAEMAADGGDDAAYFEDILNSMAVAREETNNSKRIDRLKILIPLIYSFQKMGLLPKKTSEFFDETSDSLGLIEDDREALSDADKFVTKMEDYDHKSYFTRTALGEVISQALEPRIVRREATSSAALDDAQDSGDARTSPDADKESTEENECDTAPYTLEGEALRSHSSFNSNSEREQLNENLCELSHVNEDAAKTVSQISKADTLSSPSTSISIFDDNSPGEPKKGLQGFQKDEDEDISECNRMDSHMSLDSNAKDHQPSIPPEESQCQETYSKSEEPLPRSFNLKPLDSYEPTAEQMYSTVFSGTYFDIPGRAPRWATHHGATDYQGTWIPQIPRFAIQKYSKPNDLVLSNFMGRGSDLIESWLNGRYCVGIDINPKSLNITQKNLSFILPENGRKVTNIYNRPLLIQGDSRNLHGPIFASDKFDLVLSHPPYHQAILYSVGIPGDLSLHSSLPAFMKNYRLVIGESLRVLKPEKTCLLCIGDNREHCYIQPLGFEMILEYLKCGFVIKELIIKRQRNCAGTIDSGVTLSIIHGFLLMSHEYVVVFQKPKYWEPNLSSLRCESAFFSKYFSVERSLFLDPDPRPVTIRMKQRTVPERPILWKPEVDGTVWEFEVNEDVSIVNQVLTKCVERFAVRRDGLVFNEFVWEDGWIARGNKESMHFEGRQRRCSEDIVNGISLASLHTARRGPVSASGFAMNYEKYFADEVDDGEGSGSDNAVSDRADDVDSEEPTEGRELSEYERKRMKNIEANNELLKNLGLHSRTTREDFLSDIINAEVVEEWTISSEDDNISLSESHRSNETLSKEAEHPSRLSLAFVPHVDKFSPLCEMSTNVLDALEVYRSFIKKIAKECSEKLHRRGSVVFGCQDFYVPCEYPKTDIKRPSELEDIWNDHSFVKQQRGKDFYGSSALLVGNTELCPLSVIIFEDLKLAFKECNSRLRLKEIITVVAKSREEISSKPSSSPTTVTNSPSEMENEDPLKIKHCIYFVYVKQ